MIKHYIRDEDKEGITIDDIDIVLKSKKPYFSEPKIIKFNIYNEGGLI